MNRRRRRWKNPILKKTAQGCQTPGRFLHSKVELIWVDTESNPSDLLTKAITSKAKFDRFAKVILGAVDGTYAAFVASAPKAIVNFVPS